VKVLLDEQLPHSLRDHHDTKPVAYAGMAGLKKGALLTAAEEAGFDVLVTGDKTLHYEQELSDRKIAVVSLSAVEWPVIGPHIAKIIAVIDQAKPSSFLAVDCGLFSRKRYRSPGPTL
jgi:hypothetical protein